MKISLVNLGNKAQIVPKGTDLGELCEAQVDNLLEDNGDETLRVNQIKDVPSDLYELSTQVNSLTNWKRIRRDRMRKLGQEYRDTLTILDLHDETLLVRTKVGQKGSRLDWCVDCRDPPPGDGETKVSKIFHHNRPPDDEQSSSEDEYFDVSNEVFVQEINDIMEDLGLEWLFPEEDPINETELDANGLSRRPPEDEDFDKVRMLRKKSKVMASSGQRRIPSSPNKQTRSYKVIILYDTIQRDTPLISWY